MAALVWTLASLYAAGGHPSSAPPPLHSPLVVQVGQNTSLTCSLMSCTGITWYLLRSDQLMPLLTLTSSKVGRDTANFYRADNSRVNSVGSLEGANVRLEILEVKEEDAGLYFCTGRCAGAVVVNRGVHLVVGVLAKTMVPNPLLKCSHPVSDLGRSQPSRHVGVWGSAFFQRPSSSVVVVMVGCYLCSGRGAVCCCCDPARGDTSQRVSKVESLHYSSLKLEDKPRPCGRGRTGLAKEEVVYSSVTEKPSGRLSESRPADG